MDFVEKPFEELLAQAKAEDKVIFIDAYTTWCGPCKMMAAKVFPDPEVGEVYNERFINAKFDMEKGEGPGLAKRYGVAVYPTYLFVDGNGDIVHKGLGYIPQEEFLALADAAVGDENLGALNRQYDGGDRSPEFLQSYAKTLTGVYEQEKASMVMSSYLETVDKADWTKPEVMEMIIGNPGDLGGDKMNFLVENAEAAMKAAGSGSFLMTMQQAIIGKYMKDNAARALPEVDKIAPMYAEYAAPIKDRLTAHYGMLKAQQTRDASKSIPASMAYFEAYPSDDFSELNSIAWDIYENADDEATLAAGIKFAKQSVALNENYMNLDTLAWLYKKTGDQKMAEATATKAINIAKKEEMDYSSTEEIFEK
ncbi:MAG: thiol-disulfide isomerase/thioredoxin [Neolewinella sp.]|jgi:thiol-disulfide isomerase/thioredoxin